MKNNHAIFKSFLQAMGVLAYVSLVAWIMVNGEKIFGKMNDVYGPVMFLMLFVVSAMITSMLVFGQPAMLYFDGKKKEGIELLLWTAGWLAGITAAIFAIAVLAR